MPLPISPMLVYIFVAAGGAVILASLVLLVRETYYLAASLWFPRAAMPHHERKACRYCRLGRATLSDESVRVEGDDLVEVRCFVCCSCGLPQWTVIRTPVLKSAA